MRITGLNKVNKHKRFNYTPRYYNPDKEEREARNEMIKEELGLKDENEERKEFKPDFKQKFAGKHLERYNRPSKPPLYRTVIAVVTILLLVAVVFLTVYLSSTIFKNA